MPPPYSFSGAAEACSWLAPLVGAIIGEFWGHWFNDWKANRYIQKHNGLYVLEDRLWGVWAPTLSGFVGEQSQSDHLFGGSWLMVDRSHTVRSSAAAHAALERAACRLGDGSVRSFVRDHGRFSLLLGLFSQPRFTGRLHHQYVAVRGNLYS